MDEVFDLDNKSSNVVPNHVVKTFNITPEHFDFICSVDRNQSNGLRMILDRVISEDKHKSLNPVLDRILIFCCFGFILFSISYLMIGWIKLVCICIGVFLVVYGLIGGIGFALQFSKKQKR